MKQPNLKADPTVRLSDASLSYPARGGVQAYDAITGLTLDVKRGEVLGILGESGSGKSTLSRFVTARADDSADKRERIALTGGEAHLFDVNLARPGRRLKNQLTAYSGYLAQNAGATLVAGRTIGDTLMTPLSERSRDFDRQAAGEKIAELMDLAELPLAHLQDFPYQLSKGQRQRVALITSLMLEPTLYVADEPTLGVDAKGRPKILEILQRFRETHEPTMILVSHDIAVLEGLVERVVVLQEGQMVGLGDINDIFRKTEHAYVQQLAEALRTTAYDELADNLGSDRRG